MKKLIAFITIFLSLSVSYHDVSANENTAILTIAEAQEIAIKESPQISIDNLDIKSKESAIKEAKLNMNAADFSQSASQLRKNFIERQTSPIYAELNFEVAKKNKEENIKMLKFNVYKSCLDLLLADKDLEKEKAKLNKMLDIYKIMDSKRKLGIITSDYIEEYDYQISSKMSDVKKAEYKRNSCDIELKKILNMSLDKNKIVIKDDFTWTQMKNVDINNVITNKVNTDFLVYEKSQILVIKKQILDYYRKYYIAGDYAFDQANYDFDYAQNEYVSAKLNIEVQIKNKYNEYLNKLDDLNLASKYESLVKSKLSIINTKYKKGIISVEKWLAEEMNHIDASYQKYVAIHNYNILKAEFENLIS